MISSRTITLLVIAFLCTSAVFASSNASLYLRPPQCDTCGTNTILSGDSLSVKGIDPIKLGIVSGITLAGFTYGLLLENNIWWKGERSEFHFEWKHDWAYALGADKLGHAYFPYLVSNVYDQAFLWTGMDSSASIWTASSAALAYQTYIEIRDGFSKAWGFSWGDFTADVLGAAYPVMQRYYPSLGNVVYKMSFFPSARFRAGSNSAIIDDYESSFHWLSFNLHSMIPGSVGAFIPPFINVALGDGVSGLDDKGAGHHELYLAIDWNLDGLPGNGCFWNLLKHNLNFYHFPSPAIRLYPSPVLLGIKF